MLICKHCGVKNEPKSRFCEACGKRIRRGSSSDGIFVLVLILAIVLIGLYAHSQGYALQDVMKIVSNYMPKT